jgi:hypothetical protein
MDFYIWMVELFGGLSKVWAREEAESVAVPAEGPMIPPFG